MKTKTIYCSACDREVLIKVPDGADEATLEGAVTEMPLVVIDAPTLARSMALVLIIAASLSLAFMGF